jgi:hypothetical protein
VGEFDFAVTNAKTLIKRNSQVTWIINYQVQPLKRSSAAASVGSISRTKLHC